MSYFNSFCPQGNTVLVAASSSTGVAATQLTTNPGIQMAYIANPSTALPVYVAFGSSSVAASYPSTTTPSAGMCIPFNSARVFVISPSLTNNWISAVTSAGASLGLFATPGYGQ
jgi:hypothetical protein